MCNDVLTPLVVLMSEECYLSERRAGRREVIDTAAVQGGRRRTLGGGVRCCRAYVQREVGVHSTEVL